MAEQVWTVKSALDWTQGYLETKGDENPRLSSEWLLCAATGLSRVEIYMHFDRPLSDEERAVLREGVVRRAQGEPLQYVTGEVAFRHIILKVGPGVLIPRPETEMVVQKGLDYLWKLRGQKELPFAQVARSMGPHKGFRVLDLCTGSGAIALAIASEFPGARIWATELSPQAAVCAQANIDRLGFNRQITLLEGSLAGPLDPTLFGSFDLVISNPPYVPTKEVDATPGEVYNFEPHLALDGGEDGLDIFREILQSIPALLRTGGAFVCELDERNVCDGARIVQQTYTQCEVLEDLTGRNRMIFMVKA